MPLLLHRISLPIRFGLCAHSTRPRAGCQTRAKKQSLTQSVRPRKVGSAPGGLTACYRLTAHKKIHYLFGHMDLNFSAISWSQPH